MLPIDAFEAVIDEACDDTPSLRQLSLLCRAFQPRTRYHLFESIMICTLEQLETSHEFIDLHPWLPPLVRRITLSAAFPDVSLNRNIRLLDMVPVHLLCRMPNLRTWRMRLQTYDIGITKARLSFHRSALSCYQRYGKRTSIQHLELSKLCIEDISDFVGLVSAFSAIDSLTCSCLQFRTAKGYNLSQHSSETRGTAHRGQLKLKLCVTSVDIGAVEYLFTSSATTLNSLVMTIDETSLFLGRDCTERLEALISQLLQLSSLTTVIILPHKSFPITQNGVLLDLRWVTRILERVTRALLVDICVELILDVIARLGSALYWGGIPMQTCKALEDALLSSPRRHILLRIQVLKRRTGRIEFWSTAIKHAFPRLDERGCLTIIRSLTNIDAPDLVGHEHRIEGLVPSHDSKWMITASQDGTIIAWDTEHGPIVHEWPAHLVGFEERTYALALSPDSRRLVSVGPNLNGTAGLVVWDISLSVRKATGPKGYTGIVTACAWCPDGALIASASFDGVVSVWDALTFQPHAMIGDAGSQPRLLQFSPDARYLAWSSFRSKGKQAFYIWSCPKEGQPEKLLIPLNCDATIHAISFDPQSTRVATAHGCGDEKVEDCAVRIWDIETGAVLAVIAGHTARVISASFTPDGRSVLSIQDDGPAKIWDATSWKEIVSLKPGGGGFRNGCLSPDGKYVATLSGIRVQLWRASDGLCVATFSEHKSWTSHVANGEFLASADEDGIVHIRRLSNFV